jgi:hypothetical protein
MTPSAKTAREWCTLEAIMERRAIAATACMFPPEPPQRFQDRLWGVFLADMPEPAMRLQIRRVRGRIRWRHKKRQFYARR